MVLANRAAAAYHRSMLLAPDVAPPPAIIGAHCPAGYAHVRCGFLRVPLDHQNPTGPTIRVYFERYLRRDGRDPAATTVVVFEGGRFVVEGDGADVPWLRRGLAPELPRGVGDGRGRGG